MNPELLKLLASNEFWRNLFKYGISSMLLAYTIFILGEIVVARLDTLATRMQAMLEIQSHSNIVQERMLEEMEESNNLHRIRYGLKLEPPHGS